MADADFAASSSATAHLFRASLDDELVVEGDDGHHLQRVRRVRGGERLTVADGSGTWRCYEVTAAEHGRLVLGAAGDAREEPRLRPGLAVAFALSKGSKPEASVAALTELGVDRILPFRSARSVVRWDGDRAAAATERLRRVAREAAMQSRRARVPEVAEPAHLDDLCGAPGLVVGDRVGIAADQVPIPTGGEWLAVVGAEGGFAHDERARLLAGPGAVALAVGPHVLRTETAAVALAAALTTLRSGGGHSA